MPRRIPRFPASWIKMKKVREGARCFLPYMPFLAILTQPAPSLPSEPSSGVTSSGKHPLTTQTWARPLVLEHPGTFLTSQSTLWCKCPGTPLSHRSRSSLEGKQYFKTLYFQLEHIWHTIRLCGTSKRSKNVGMSQRWEPLLLGTQSQCEE